MKKKKELSLGDRMKEYEKQSELECFQVVFII